MCDARGPPRYEFLKDQSLKTGVVNMIVTRSFEDEVVLKKKLRSNITNFKKIFET